MITELSSKKRLINPLKGNYIVAKSMIKKKAALALK